MIYENSVQYQYSKKKKKKKKKKKRKKKHRLSSYYNNVQQIHNRITEAPPIYFLRERLEQIIFILREILCSFKKHCPPKRKNFSVICFNKLFKILYMKEFAKYFNLPKGKQSLREHEKIWEKICKDMGWKFHPSFNV